MIGSHVGHDCRVGNGCTLVNGALVAGHVDARRRLHPLGPRRRPAAGPDRPAGDARRPGLDHQGHPPVRAPAGVQLRHRPEPRRPPPRGLASEAIAALREAFRILYKEGRTLRAALERIEADLGHVPEVDEFVAFIRESTLGINPARSGERQRRTF